MEIITIVVPPRFYDDHRRRNWKTAGEVVSITDTDVTVLMADHEIGDLYSDAKHYAQHSEMEVGLRSSARATVRRLEKQLGEEACMDARTAFKSWDGTPRIEA